MARAILKRSKIVICDEATSSLDQQTDRLVTQTIAEGFEGSTMLVIGALVCRLLASTTTHFLIASAHRLRTVIEFDKILVMHEGTVAEYDTPANLLSDSNSRFYALCQAVSSVRQHVWAIELTAASADRTSGICKSVANLRRWTVMMV